LFLSGCGGKPSAEAPKPLRPVTAAVVETRDVPVYLDEIGNCTAYETVMFQPQVTGAITAIHFKDGAEVHKDELLFSIPAHTRRRWTRRKRLWNRTGRRLSMIACRSSATRNSSRQR